MYKDGCFVTNIRNEKKDAFLCWVSELCRRETEFPPKVDKASLFFYFARFCLFLVLVVKVKVKVKVKVEIKLLFKAVKKRQFSREISGVR